MNNELPKVCVIVATYNGEKYLQNQIDSILMQEGVNLSIIARDDGSTDKTVDILSEYEDKGLLRLFKGDNLGPADNFYKSTQEAPIFEYYAWSDQDDIWDKDKLIKGIEAIRRLSGPALYYSASRTIDAEENVMGLIGYENPSLTFEQALIQSKAQGCTFIFNESLYLASKKYTPCFKRLGILHDAWLHRMCLSIGGVVVHDPTPHMSYRIHESNVIAQMPTNSIFQRIDRATRINSLHYCSDVAQALIDGYGEMMTPSNYELAKIMAEYRNNALFKLRLLLGHRIRVNSWKDNIKFKYNVLLNRM